MQLIIQLNQIHATKKSKDILMSCVVFHIYQVLYSLSPYLVHGVDKNQFIYQHVYACVTYLMSSVHLKITEMNRTLPLDFIISVYHFLVIRLS